jgi:hypothetical protein
VQRNSWLIRSFTYWIVDCRFYYEISAVASKSQPSRRRHDVTKSFLFFLYPTASSDRCKSIGAILIFIGTFCTQELILKLSLVVERLTI